MQIKDDNKKSFFRRLLKDLAVKKLIILIKAVFILIIFLCGIVGGLLISGFFGTLDNPSQISIDLMNKIGIKEQYYKQSIIKGILKNNFNIPLNYLSGLKSDPEEIRIDIKYLDYQKLAYYREQALLKYDEIKGCHSFLSGSEKEVPATITYNGKKIEAKLRLKGKCYDHWIDKEKWSFRISIKGDEALFGMKEFSIQHPKTRDFVSEWVIHKFLKYNGIISVKYDFIDVVINGEERGIYAIEEHFDKILIENNNQREGIIIMFDDMLVFGQFNFDEVYQSSPIVSAQMKKIKSNEELMKQFMLAKDLLESFRQKKLKTHQIFDSKKLAKFFAITDLFGGRHHATYITNLRFYYNPVTSLIEPIGYDFGEIMPTTYLIGTNKIAPPESQTTANEILNLRRTFFEDEIFFREYIAALEEISKKEVLDEFFEEINVELKEKLNILYKEFPWLYFPSYKSTIYKNQEVIVDMLHNFEGILVYLNDIEQKKILNLEIANIHSMPIEIVGINYNGMIFEPVQKIIYPLKEMSEPLKFKIISFYLPENITFSESMVEEMQINYRILGESIIKTKSIIPWSHLNKDFLNTDLIRQKPNADAFDFIYTDDASRAISIKPGTWVLNETLIFPKGYTIYWFEGTILDLRNKANIISYSPLRFSGSEDSPIKIISSDSSGQGVVILDASETSYLEHTTFDRLSAPSSGNWGLTGAVTFYQSPFFCNGCVFSNSNSEDSLNIIRSEFELTNTVFENSFSDSLDVDFGKGMIASTTLLKCGSDCLDFSGSIISLKNILATGSGDKGISVGENSNVNATNIRINNAMIGIASKDLSEVIIDRMDISDSKYGLVAYQKKPEFGPSSIISSNTKLSNIEKETLIEEGSSLLLNNQLVEGSEKKVFQQLYGSK